MNTADNGTGEINTQILKEELNSDFSGEKD